MIGLMIFDVPSFLLITWEWENNWFFCVVRRSWRSLASTFESYPNQVQCNFSYFWISTTVVSCYGRLLWLLRSCSRFAILSWMNFFPFILPVLYNFWFLMLVAVLLPYYCIEVENIPWTIRHFGAFIFWASASLIYLFSLMASAMSLCLAVSRASDGVWPLYFSKIWTLLPIFTSFYKSVSNSDGWFHCDLIFQLPFSWSYYIIILDFTLLHFQNCGGCGVY